MAYIRNQCSEFYQVPYQVGVLPEMTSIIEFEKGLNFEVALGDLEGFERIWVIFVFDKVKSWKPMIQPPRGDRKVGVFSCRSPHRPNPIGMSAVELVKIEGCRLFIRNHDFLDGTPVLDIKPYIPEVDSYENSKLGWLGAVSETRAYELVFNERVKREINFLANNNYDLLSLAEVNLRINPLPKPNNRVKCIDDSLYVLAVKTWRVLYRLEESKVLVENVISGYDEDTLLGKKSSKWDDVWLHRKFKNEFLD